MQSVLPSRIADAKLAEIDAWKRYAAGKRRQLACTSFVRMGAKHLSVSQQHLSAYLYPSEAAGLAPLRQLHNSGFLSQTGPSITGIDGDVGSGER